MKIFNWRIGTGVNFELLSFTKKNKKNLHLKKKNKKKKFSDGNMYWGIGTGMNFIMREISDLKQ